MKKIVFKGLIFCFLICGSFSTSYAQASINEDLKDVESLVQKMFVDMNNRDFDALLSMTHPKVFELLPKENMKTILKSMFEGNEDMSIEVPKLDPIYKLSEVFKGNKDNLVYAFVSYDLNMKMTFQKQEFDEEAKKMMTTTMITKGMDVEFLSNNTMSILMKDSMTIILKDDSTSNEWVMVNYDPDSPLFYQILSSDLMEKAKVYKQDLMLERKKNSEK